MFELAILFLHHTDDELTRYHADLLQKRNPKAAFVPLTFNKGMSGAICPIPREVVPTSLEERNSDMLVYYWFRSGNAIAAQRYIIIEYDTLCSLPLQDFYRDVWNEPVAGAAIVTTENGADWWWFREIQDRTVYGQHLSGIVPISGILLSRHALSEMASRAFDSIYLPLYCECRIATLARASGFDLMRIRPDAQSYISCESRNPTHPGVWHAVKTVSVSVPL